MGTCLKNSLSELQFDFACCDPVSCMFCEESFTVLEDHQPFLKHLLDVHHFLFDSIEEIVDLRQYIIYWRKLKDADLEDFCIVYQFSDNKESSEYEGKYYLLSKNLKEDKELRSVIKKRKICYVTQQKDLETKEIITRQCIYCRDVLTGKVAEIFDHLSSAHGFSLGNADNIVFGSKLLDIMEQKITSLICLCCEKTFRDIQTLREHKRKKHHKTLNPKNSFYDQFYMRSYLKPGIAWKQAKAEIFLESEGEELSGSETEDSPVDEETAKCLFCSYEDTVEPKRLQYHMEKEHNFCLNDHFESISFHEKIKLVNFIRSKVYEMKCIFCDLFLSSSESLLEHMHRLDHYRIESRHRYGDNRYLKPVIEDDALLRIWQADDSEQVEIVPEDIKNIDYLPSSTACEYLELSGPSAQNRKLYGFQCFFCPFVCCGSEAKTRCMTHMLRSHAYNAKQELKNLSASKINKLVNYLRYKTMSTQCFICDQTFESQELLNQHRTSSEHLHTPHYSLYHDDKWLTPTVEKDRFLIQAWIPKKKKN